MLAIQIIKKYKIELGLPSSVHIQLNYNEQKVKKFLPLLRYFFREENLKGEVSN
jgi:hypothetical protein